MTMNMNEKTTYKYNEEIMSDGLAFSETVALRQHSGNGFAKKLIVFFGILLACIFIPFAADAQAGQLTPEFSSTDGSDGANILDNSNYTSEGFDTAGTVLTLKSSEKIGYVYIKWNKAPGEWKLTAGTEEITCGQDGFLHELVELSTSVNEVKITIPEAGTRIVDVYIYSPGDLPDDVQKWEPQCEKADILFISSHADDEVLFFGGVIPNYTNNPDVAVQVAYFTEHYSTGEDMRMQEALDGLWAMGVRHYPQFGEFKDVYSESIEEALTQYDEDAGLEYIVRTIRKFKPQVVVTHDENGEYGHGCHRLVSKLVRDGVVQAADSTKYTDSVSQYGTWDTPKTYLHLYSENQIEMNARVPLENLGGQTALEIAKAAYLKHDSQQYCWFYVSDGYDDDGNPNGYELSCTKYGLYRTTVGNDTSTDDMFDNITFYSKQAAVEETTTEAETGDEAETTTAAETEKEKSKGSPVLVIIIIIVVIAAAAVIITTALKRKRRREMEARRRRQAAMARRRAAAGNATRRPNANRSNSANRYDPNRRNRR